MPIKARYVHTNIVGKDWRRLVKFYQDVFGCEPVPPERDYSGQFIEDVTAVPNARIRGLHLRVPGYGPEGPTLEIFEYAEQPPRPPTRSNQPGFAHIAFHVDDVEAARQAVLDAGGGELGKLLSAEVPGAGTVTLIYMTDPEGNIVELQHWHA